MNTPNTKNMSPFVLAALSLDDDFAQLERLSGEIDRLPIDTDNGLERAKLLLTRFTEAGQRIGEGVQSLAKSLDEARQRAEAAAQVVSTRAELIQQRQTETEQMLGRFQSLGDMAKKISTAVGQLHNPASGSLTEEQKALLAKHLPELDSQLGVLVDEARKLKDDASVANMRALERNADSMAQSLQSVRLRLKDVG